MLNYLKSELYRILRSKGSYLFIAVCSVLLASSNVVLFFIKQAEETFSYATTAFSVGNLIGNFGFIFLLCIMVSGIIFNNENSNHTFKNCVSYGISRGIIYLGKLLIQLFYAIIAFTIIVASHVGTAYLLLDNTDPKVLGMLLDAILAALPLFFFVIAVANCFYFMIEGTGGAVAATCGIIMALPIMFGFLGMKFEIIRNISDILPWNLLGNIKLNMDNYSIQLFWSSNGHLNYWIAGVAQMVLFVILGYVMFNKKEIK